MGNTKLKLIAPLVLITSCFKGELEVKTRRAPITPFTLNDGQLRQRYVMPGQILHLKGYKFDDTFYIKLGLNKISPLMLSEGLADIQVPLNIEAGAYEARIYSRGIKGSDEAAIKDEKGYYHFPLPLTVITEKTFPQIAEVIPQAPEPGEYTTIKGQGFIEGMSLLVNDKPVEITYLSEKVAGFVMPSDDYTISEISLFLANTKSTPIKIIRGTRVTPSDNSEAVSKDALDQEDPLSVDNLVARFERTHYQTRSTKRIMIDVSDPDTTNTRVFINNYEMSCDLISNYLEQSIMPILNMTAFGCTGTKSLEEILGQGSNLVTIGVGHDNLSAVDPNSHKLILRDFNVFDIFSSGFATDTQVKNRFQGWISPMGQGITYSTEKGSVLTADFHHIVNY